MNINWTAILASLIAGLATAVGALPIYFKRSYTKSSLDVGMGFSAGIMLVASFISLIIPSMEMAEKLYHTKVAFIPVMLGLFAGYFFIIFIHEVMPHEHIFKDKDMGHKTQLSRVSLIILAITLHNLPEGLSVGVGFGANEFDGAMSLAVGIALQNMPEGLVVAIGLLSEGASRNKAFFMALLSGMVEPVAAIFGFISTQFTQMALPFCLSFAGGTMLFVICQEIFPELFGKGHEKKATFGVVFGIATMLLLDSLI